MISVAKRLLHRILRSLNKKIVPTDTFGTHSVVDVFSILRNVRGTFSVLDVGANIGFFSQEVVLTAPNSVVHAFEPFPAAYDQLQKRSQASDGRIVPHMNAMSDQVGTSLLYLNSADVTNSLLPNADAAVEYQPNNYSKPVGTLEVSLNTVDLFCTKESISFIHLLKIDTQGSDLKVLKGAIGMIESDSVCAILVEVLFVPLYGGQCWFHEIYAWLGERDFQLVHLYEINRDPTLQFSKWADALFVRRGAIKKACAISTP
jgi:FkbM family methyltransferase